MKVGWRPPEDWVSRIELTPQEERFIQTKLRRERFLTANSLCIMLRNCLWHVSIHQNHLEPSQIHMKGDQNIDILPLWKHFMTGTALHTNEIMQRCMTYLVLNKFVIAFTVNISVLISTLISVINMRICNVLLNFLFQYNCVLLNVEIPWLDSEKCTAAELATDAWMTSD